MNLICAQMLPLLDQATRQCDWLSIVFEPSLSKDNLFSLKPNSLIRLTDRPSLWDVNKEPLSDIIQLVTLFI